MKIDLVITYVDNTNADWQANYLVYKNPFLNSYWMADKQQLKYLLRSVDINLPFINQVFLIVQNTSEVPKYVNTSKVKIITHKEFIPQEYLPTFNSTTIEAFLWNISGLSEHFLYLNDDILILNKLAESDFYTKDNKAITYFYPYYFKNVSPTDFEEILINSNELVWNINREKALSKGYTLCVTHTIRPYFKSAYRECYNKYWDNISISLTRFRNSKNYILYIVDSYQNKIGKSINSLTITLDRLNNNADDLSILSIINNKPDTLCIDTTVENINIYNNITFLNFLNSTFNIPSKYEQEEN